MRLWVVGGLFEGNGMRMSTKVVAGFAVAGFALPLLFLTSYAIADHFDVYPSYKLFFFVCPSSIMQMALDMDGPIPLLEGVIVWLVICISNAVLYAAPALAVVVIYRVIRPDPEPSGPWLR
jgi:hypothetical protein